MFVFVFLLWVFWDFVFILVVVFGSCCCFMFGHLNLGGPSKSRRSTKLVPPLS